MVPWLSTSICSFLVVSAAAVPTWPASSDELEDIMFLNTGYRAREFSKDVTPCSAGQAPGRNTAAEWIRTAFHDMVAGPVQRAAGGLDASIVFETAAAEHNGPGFRSTLNNLAPFFSSQSSMADLIALSTYTATRSCGGPIVQVRTGRQDVSVAGSVAFTPQPQNSVETFSTQFRRLGFNSADMITFTACGHTVGGVHAGNFPEIVARGSVANDYAHLDSTVANFDRNVMSEYLASNTTNPLVVGPSRSNGRDSDRRIYQLDNNATAMRISDPAVFQTECARVFQKMIEVVPTNVQLSSDPLQAYEVKPVAPQLTLQNGGTSMAFTGEIRVRTTNRAASSIRGVQLVYKDRTGAACTACTINTAVAGAASGFDDSFSFYGFSAQIPTSTSISSFNVVITRADGSIETFDNNGASFPVQDGVIFQQPQSCITDSSDASKKSLTLVAAVREAGTAVPVNSTLIFKQDRTNNPGVNVPRLSTESYFMARSGSAGPYTLYSYSYAINSTQTQNTVFGISTGAGTAQLGDLYKQTKDLTGQCAPLGDASPSSTSSSVSSTRATSSSADAATTSSALSISVSSSVTLASSSASASSLVSSVLVSSTHSDDISTSLITTPVASSSSALVSSSAVSSYISSVSSVASSSAATSNYTSVPTVASSSTVTIVQSSSLSSVQTSSAAISTSESSLTSTNSVASPSDTFSSTADGSNSSGSPSSLTPSSSAASSPTPAISSSSYATGSKSTPDAHPTSESTRLSTVTPIIVTVTGSACHSTSTPTPSTYAYQGCFTDSVSSRALHAAAMNSDGLSIEQCADFCSNYALFGVEYGRECYCGNARASNSLSAPETECNMACTGNAHQNCGNGDRLGVYENLKYSKAKSGALAGYTYKGCWTDTRDKRTLSKGKVYDGKMMIEMCQSQSQGSKYFGLEYGSECYYGDELNGVSIEVDEDECGMRCAGDGSQLCGDGDRLSVYEKTS